MPPSHKNWIWVIRHSPYTVILDACTLYPAPLRDLLIELAAAGLFRAKWTDKIHEEWITNLLKDRTDIDRKALERTKALMNDAVADCLVEGYEGLIDSLHLPDGDDRHVLAAAIRCGANSIITFNLKDFPQEAIEKYDIDALHPDDFIFHQLGLAMSGVVAAAQRCRARLKNPPKTAQEYLATLESQGLTKTVAELQQYADVI